MEGQGLGAMMTYGDGGGNTTTHHYAGTIENKGKKKPKKGKCKKSLSKKPV